MDYKTSNDPNHKQQEPVGVVTKTDSLSSQTNKNKKSIIAIFLAVIVFITSVIYFSNLKKLGLNPSRSLQEISKITTLSKFKSADEFKKYLSDAQNIKQYDTGIRDLSVSVGMSALEGTDYVVNKQAQTPSIDRISGTNIQVSGVDEPDILKTDRNNIYYSYENYYRVYDSVIPAAPQPEKVTPDTLEVKMMPSYGPKTRIINSFPPSNLKELSQVGDAGNLLINENILIIFPYGKIVAYDINDSQNPKKIWVQEYSNNTQLVSARLFNKKIYLVTKTGINIGSPCPLPVMKDSLLDIVCTDIYRPQVVISTDSIFTVSIIDPMSGNVEQKTSLVGSSSNSVIYMSKDYMYLTYQYEKEILDIYYSFFTSDGAGLLPSNLIARINEIRGYTLKNSTKLMEVNTLLEEYKLGLSDDERLRFENDIQNKLTSYMSNNLRSLQSTQIIKIGLTDLDIQSVGSIPGTLLNQFSLDEFQENMRVAVTLGGWIGWENLSLENANDIYILNKEMEIVGSIKDLGLGERIYSARFLGDKGYLVTFRQTDPFYVLDLKDPKNPRKSGELKIPGFSSYLHPLEDNLILGVGQENSQVKLSLFDVTNPSNPTEISKYNLDEYFSDVQNTHHAFTQDTDNMVFFIPGGKGGYIFSYDKNSINLVKAISETNVKRGLYINNYFFVVGDSGITVLNESDWEKINSLEYKL